MHTNVFMLRKNGLKNYGLYTEHMLNFYYLLSKYFDVVNQTVAEIVNYVIRWALSNL